MSASNPLLPDLGAIPIKDRISILWIERCQIDVIDGSFVSVLDSGDRTHIPVGGVACLMLEPGTRISHNAVVLAARTGTLLVWVGESSVRMYSAGQPGGARSDKLLYQAKLALEDSLRLKVVRKMYSMRFGEQAPPKRSVEQLRGIEGARVRKTYQLLAQKFGVPWKSRSYDIEDWGAADPINKALSSATSCLYGVTESAVLAAGYAPAIGFVHTGKPLSFVYDIADIFKFDTVVPLAFSIAKKNPDNIEREVRLGCRDMFRRTKLLERIIPTIEEILAAGEISKPEPAPEQVLPAFIETKGVADDGHRR